MVQIVNPGFQILTPLNGMEILKRIEAAARTCYKSEGLITEDGVSALKLVEKLVKNGHWAMIEFGGSIGVKFTCDRGVSHEFVRHRLASFAQESTRYCNYAKSDEITVIKPMFWAEDSLQFKQWVAAMEFSERTYLLMIKYGATPQEARSVLPNSLKTEINLMANVREWYHILEQRTAPSAHPQMREIMIPLLNEFKKQIPIIFDNIKA